MSQSAQQLSPLGLDAPAGPSYCRTSAAPTLHSIPIDSSNSGVILLSSSKRILHMNARARVLMGLFGEALELWPNLSPESMPSILLEFCGEIMSESERRAQAGDRAQFEMRRVCHMVTPPLLFRGFGVSTSASGELQMILTLQPYAPLFRASLPE